MALFDFLRRKDETAIPDPGSREFRRAVEGSALPGSTGPAPAGGWASFGDASSVEELGSRVLRDHEIDPDKKDRTIDAASVPGLERTLMHLAQQRDAGQISEAEFEAQKRRLLGG